MKKIIHMPISCTDPKHLASIYDPEINHLVGIDFSDIDMSEYGWFTIGAATIHLDLIDPKDTVSQQVEALQTQITKTMADCEATITVLRSRINNLLAIESNGE